MKRRQSLWIAVVAIGGMLSEAISPATACTGICLKPQDGSVLAARTLEFAANLRSQILVIPRGSEFIGATPDGQPGLTAKTKYAVLGANGFGLPDIVDGLNERGLGVANFYFPGYAKYQEIAPSDVHKTIAPWQLPTYLLGQCATVDEAVRAVRSIRVGAVFQKNMNMVPPCHYVIHDAGGRCAVVEYVDGKLSIYENPLGVFTNSPGFDWHVTNLRNYVNLTVNNVPPIELDGLRFSSFGQGSGMLGLPGDFTPPSRFIRAVAFSQSALPAATARDGVLQAFHILNQFDIPKGAVRGAEHGQETSDYTLWTSVADLTHQRYYFRTFENSRIRMMDLHRMDLNAKEIKKFSMGGDEVIEDLSTNQGTAEQGAGTGNRASH